MEPVHKTRFESSSSFDFYPYNLQQCFILSYHMIIKKNVYKSTDKCHNCFTIECRLLSLLLSQALGSKVIMVWVEVYSVGME